MNRVTGRELALVAPMVRIGEPAGIAVTRLTSTDDPEDAGDDDEVTLVAVDRSAGRVLSNLGLMKVGTWDGSDSDLGPLSSPSDVAIDRDGRVAITDTGNRRVVLLRHDGSSLRPVDQFPGFMEPRGVAADGKGGFYVCDRRFQTVVHLDTKTGKRTTFGLEVAFELPIAVATVGEGDRMARGGRRVVVIVDQDGKRLRVFDPAGALRATRLASSLSAPDARFDDVDVDYYGNILAVDRAGNRMHKFRDDLYPLDTFGTRDGDPGYRAPRGIAIHRRLGQVFLTEEAGGVYLWVGTDITGLAARSDGSGLAFSYLLTEESDVSARILDPQGKVAVTLMHESRQQAGPQRGSWDGSDGSGVRLQPGKYLLEVRARATYASRSSHEARRLQPFTLGPAR
jgi:sugar lactone lactonase YvrE